MAYGICYRPESITTRHRTYISENLRNANVALAGRVAKAIDEIKAVAVEEARQSQLDVSTPKKARIEDEKSPQMSQRSGSPAARVNFSRFEHATSGPHRAKSTDSPGNANLKRPLSGSSRTPQATSSHAKMTPDGASSF
jgi:hypothetical protein